MTGETDLATMLASIAVHREPGTFCFISDASSDIAPELAAQSLATVREAEGMTHVVPVEAARSHGIEPHYEAAWLTLEVHSALEAVGLTAAFSRALADARLSCNVLAGFHHDHLLVPADQANDAIAAIESLRES